MSILKSRFGYQAQHGVQQDLSPPVFAASDPGRYC